jgi:hypothetical protein
MNSAGDMRKQFAGFVALYFYCQGVFSQTILRGSVISEETQKPLPSASVYLNNTSLGTITSEQGLFVINKIPSGKFRLVVSCVGYEAYISLIDPRVLSKDFMIALKTKPQELAGFSVTSESRWLEEMG